jgi:hypothetical protein
MTSHDQKVGRATTVAVDAAHASDFGRDLDASNLAALNRGVLRRLGGDLELMLQQAAQRLVQQTLAEALPATWLRRAEQFEAVGTAAADETARACRRHAWVLSTAGLDSTASEMVEVMSA